MQFVMRLAKTLAAFVLPLAATAAIATPKPDTMTGPDPTAGWAEIEVKGFDWVRLADPVDFTRYKTFLVLPPELEFDRQWLREFKTDMTRHDEARLRESYTRVLQEALEESLGKDLGWKKVAEPGPDTLVVAPRLTRFRLNAPDLSLRPQTKDFVHYTGSARVTLALQNGADKRPVAELSDYSETRAFAGPGDLKQTNRVENLHDFKMLAKRWAKRFTEYLAQPDQP